MSTATDNLSPEYLVAHGHGGGIGRYAPAAALACRRGDRVVVESRRGLEVGVVLCEANPNHARLLPTAAGGRLLRQATAADEQALERLRPIGQQLFEAARRRALEQNLPLEIVDVELLLDGRAAVLQYLAWAEADLEALAVALGQAHGLTVLLESVAGPVPVEEAEEHGGCGKPDCGQSEGGGCSSCSTGGCSSCGSGKVDMTAYFAHLRAQMEQQQQRTPLL